MNPRCRDPEAAGECDEVPGVRGDDAVPDPRGKHDEMRIHDVSGARSAEQPAHCAVVVRCERMHDYRLRDAGQARLSRAVTPDLGKYRRSCVQGLVGSHGRCQEGTRRALAAIQRNQETRVEDHRSK